MYVQDYNILVLFFFFTIFLGNVFLGVQIINSLGGLRIPLIVQCCIY